LAIIALILVFIIAIFILKRIVSFITSKNKEKDRLDVAEDIALASKFSAIITGFFVYFVAPTGLLTFFVAPPLIIIWAPYIIAFATGSYAVYILVRLYDKKKRKNRVDN